MKLSLKRKWYHKDCTSGDLYIDGKYFCHTLENATRKYKIWSHTSIPYGTYDIDINRGNKYPIQILDVPYFGGIRIHKGNTAADTKGCILVGDKLNKNKDAISGGTSTPAYNKLLDILSGVTENIKIKILDQRLKLIRITSLLLVALITVIILTR